jgi:hypothetical protein
VLVTSLLSCPPLNRGIVRQVVMLAFMNFFSWVLPVASAGALAAYAGRQWRFAARMSRAVLFAALIFVSLLVARFVASTLSPVEPSFRASINAAGMSELIMCSTLPFVAAMVSAATWVAARRRLRSG